MVNLLTVSNYPLSYKNEWVKGYKFIEKREEHFPFDDDCELDLVNIIGSPLIPTLCLVGKRYPSDAEKRIINTFSAEASLNGEVITLRDFYGSEREALRGILAGDGRAQIILSFGLNIALKRYRELISPLLIKDFEFISCFDPDESRSKETNQICDSLISRCKDIIFFSLTSRDEGIAISALDLGNEIFLHRNCLQYKRGKRLASEGAPVIDSYLHYLTYKSKAGCR